MEEILKAKIKSFNDYKNFLTIEVKRFCQDKDIDINERWKLFIDSDLGEHVNYSPDLKSYNLEDLEHVCRYEYIFVDDLLTMVSEIWEDSEEEDEIYIRIKIMKEEILQLFIKSFIYDW